MNGFFSGQHGDSSRRTWLTHFNKNNGGIKGGMKRGTPPGALPYREAVKSSEWLKPTFHWSSTSDVFNYQDSYHSLR
ncbi:hypothetical protein BVX98_01650 [bacterium F11]|nr:hypothetical protein BVX98_01650 [bacterium F11]